MTEAPKPQTTSEAEVLMELSERNAMNKGNRYSRGGCCSEVDASCPLDASQRMLVVKKLLHGPIRPFHKWKWRKINLQRRAEIAKTSAHTVVGVSGEQNGEERGVDRGDTDTVSKSIASLHSPAVDFQNDIDLCVGEGSHVAGASQVSPTPLYSPAVSASPPLDNYTGPLSYQGPVHFDDKTHSYTATLCVIMVGLPARGKTFLAHKVCRLLGWHGHRAKVLNVQVAWRRLLMNYYNGQGDESRSERSGLKEKDPVYVRAEHFRALVSDSNSVERRLYRCVLQQYAHDAQNFYAEGGEVLVLNDDFPTEELRDEAEGLFSPLCTQTFFVEVVRSNKFNKTFDEFKVRDVMEYHSSVKLNDAKRDFERRVDYLNSVYTSVGAASCCANQSNSKTGDNSACTMLEENVAKQRGTKRYVRVNNFHEVEVCGVMGYIASRIVSFVMNVTQLKVQHPIYFVRNGMSVYHCEDRIGGDSPLSPEGEQDTIELLEFVASLTQYVEQERNDTDSCVCETAHTAGDGDGRVREGSGTCASTDTHNAYGFPDSPQRVVIWTSQLYRAIQTVEKCEQLLGIKTTRCHSLNELYAGVCENLTQAELREQCPLMQELRNCNKFSFRYPKGESYKDLVQRLEPVIMELENTDRVVVIVAHRAVLRALLTYFGSISAESCMWLDVPYRTVWKCTYDSKGMTSLEELRFDEQDEAAPVE
uniref:Fructose-2,6-bisphosphatase n=1 Tax=Trypanosoma brucei TaxID=5691 RepID=Q6PY96_9TRYP|nr:fructose-2,6-bisphosphatase [Trypanosoma brucei]